MATRCEYSWGVKIVGCNEWCVQAAGGASVGVPVVRRSEADRELALKLHMVNGLQKVTRTHKLPEILYTVEKWPQHRVGSQGPWLSRLTCLF